MIRKTIPYQGSHILVALLTIFDLGLILRSATVVRQAYCLATAGNAPNPGPCFLSAEELVPLLTSVGFGAIAVAVWMASQLRLSAIFFLLVSATIAAGLPTGWPGGEKTWTRLFYLLLAWLAPITFCFHLGLAGRALRPVEKVLLGALALLAGAATLPLLLSAPEPATDQGWFPFWRTTVRIGLAVSFVLAWMRLWREYRRRASLETRGHIRLVVFGTFFGFAPLVFLSMLPDTLQLPAHVPYVATFPWLLLAPLSYAYALYRSRWTRAELALNRAAVYYLLVVALLSLYLFATAVLNRLAANATNGSIVRNAVLTVGLVLLFAPLQRGFERLINWVLYGGEVNYVATVQHLAEALSLTLDRETLRRLLLEEWAPAMRLTRSLLLLRDEGEMLTFLGATGMEGIDHLRLPVQGALAAYLEAVDEPVPDGQVHQALKERVLAGDEQKLFSLEGWAFWLPLVSAHTLQGLLLVGPKVGMDFFTPADEQVLATVAYQAGVAAHNVRLMQDLRSGRQELAQAHQQLLIGREQERQRLAHELHDGAVQRLLGVSYALKAAGPPANDGQWQALRREVLDVVAQLRGVIGELRPAGLSELGLAAALEGYVASLRREGILGTLQVDLDLAQDDGRLPEPAAICLFRAAQEALRNALKHADAHHFAVRLRFYPEQVELEFCDDGCGFPVPARLSELAGMGHYGLASMGERVAAVGGQLTLHSGRNTGTQGTIRVPLKPKDKSHG